MSFHFDHKTQRPYRRRDDFKYFIILLLCLGVIVVAATCTSGCKGKPEKRIDLIVLEADPAESKRLKYESFHDSIHIAWDIKYASYKDSSWILLSQAQNYLFYKDVRRAKKTMAISKKYQKLMTFEYMETKRFDDSLKKYLP